MCLNDQETASIEQLKPVISGTSLLVFLMAGQYITQTVISTTKHLMALKVSLNLG